MMSMYPINQCHLYKCGSKKSLAERLCISLEDLKTISQWNTYRTWEEKKPHGGLRVIYAPSDKLKAVQRRIKELLERVERPEWVYSGSKGKCHIDNAFAHQGSRYFVLSDIASFYESSNRNAVYRFFKDSLLVEPDVASILSDLTTCLNIGGDRIIPTGSPCSQLIAYFAYSEMFDEMHQCANSYGCKMTLYVDDLTLSSKKPISNPKSMEKRLNKIASAYGHSIKWNKTHYYGPSEYKKVTGVAISGKGEPCIPNSLGESIMKGLDKVFEGDAAEYASLKGRIGAARQIDRNAFPEVERLVDHVVACAPHQDEGRLFAK